MTYRVVYEKKTIKNLAKIDNSQQRMIISWIEKNLQNSSDPKQHGKALKGQLKDYWRYRIGNYRILADIKQDEVKIIIINIGYRKDIYKL